jgi:hypothetical protein
VRRARRKVWILVTVAVAAGVVALAVRWGPALAVIVALAAPAAEPWVTWPLAAIVREETTVHAGVRVIAADVYRRPGAPPRAGLLFVHGLSAAGRRQPDLVRLARLVAATGPTVLVPHFEGLAAFRLTGREVEDVAAAVRHLRQHAPVVGVVGFSFGAGPALLAAADAGDVALVGSFGGYADLRNVARFIPTGVHAFDGVRYVTPPEPYNRWKLAALLAPFVADASLDAIVRARLGNSSADTAALEASLTADGRRVLALARVEDERDVARLLDDLPPAARAALAGLSPLPIVPRLPGRLLIAHGADDPSIPFTESLRLAEASRGRARAVVLGGFHHTGVANAWRLPVDAVRLLGVVDAIVGLR